MALPIATIVTKKLDYVCSSDDCQLGVGVSLSELGALLLSACCLSEFSLLLLAAMAARTCT